MLCWRTAQFGLFTHFGVADFLFFLYTHMRVNVFLAEQLNTKFAFYSILGDYETPRPPTVFDLRYSVFGLRTPDSMLICMWAGISNLGNDKPENSGKCAIQLKPPAIKPKSVRSKAQNADQAS